MDDAPDRRPLFPDGASGDCGMRHDGAADDADLLRAMSRLPDTARTGRVALYVYAPEGGAGS